MKQIMARHMSRDSTEGRLLESHLRLRRGLGFLGIIMPVAVVVLGLLINDGIIRGSISAYYDAEVTRTVFVGTLFAMGFFLGAYKGYETLDDALGWAACLLALGVAFFPHETGDWREYLHLPCAGGLFLILSVFSLVLFTKTKPEGVTWVKRIRWALGIYKIKKDARTPQKKRRDRI